MTGKSFSMT